MNRKWNTKKLGEVCNIIGGGTPSKANPAFYTGDILWATVRDMKHEFIDDTEFKITQEAVKESSTNIIPKGNIIIATRVGLGKICLLTHNTAINQDLRGIIPKNKNELSIRYLFWWLNSITEIIIRNGTGATVQGVKLPFIRNLDIPVPSFSEQQRIVSTLDKAFSAIEKAKFNAEQNLKNVKVVFECYLQEFFETKFAEWKEMKFKEVCNLVGGSQPSKNDFIYQHKEGYIRLIQVRDYRTDKYITYIPADKAKRFCTESDIMIGRYGPPIFGIFKGLAGAYNVALMKAEVNEEICNADYFYWFLKTNKLREFVEKSSKRAAGQDGVRKELLDEYPVPILKLSDQKKIVSQLNAMLAKTKKLKLTYQNKISRLEEIKKSILQKAFSGELNTENIDIETQVQA